MPDHVLRILIESLDRYLRARSLYTLARNAYLVHGGNVMFEDTLSAATIACDESLQELIEVHSAAEKALDNRST